MTLKSDMAADVLSVFLATDDFAETATFLPAESLTGFACTVLPGDVEEGFVDVASGTADQRRLLFVGARAPLRTGILGIEGAERDPRRGDRLTFATGVYLGTWFIERVAVDNGGGIGLYGRCETRHEVAGDIAGDGGG